MNKILYSFLPIIPLFLLLTVQLPKAEISESQGVESAMSGTAAYVEFTVLETGNPPSSGSVGVWYEGVKVSTAYNSTWKPIDVAWTISNNINHDPNIQLSATVPSGSTVRLTEKRIGSEYNGNPVYVTHTNGTHITVNGYAFYMCCGTD